MVPVYHYSPKITDIGQGIENSPDGGEEKRKKNTCIEIF